MYSHTKNVYDPNIKKIKLRLDPVVIEIVGEINETTVQDFALEMTAAQSTGQPVIPILIHSPGGDVYSTFNMMNLIRSSRVPVATYIGGIAASAAALLFTCGHPDLRFMAPDSRLMIHSVSSQMFGSVNAAGLKVEAKEAKKVNDRMCEIMAQNCSKPKTFFAEMIKEKQNTDVYIDAKKAKELGIIRGDWCNETPILVTEVKPKMYLTTTGGKKIPIPNLNSKPPLLQAENKFAILTTMKNENESEDSLSNSEPEGEEEPKIDVDEENEGEEEDTKEEESTMHEDLEVATKKKIKAFMKALMKMNKLIEAKKELEIL